MLEFPKVNSYPFNVIPFGQKVICPEFTKLGSLIDDITIKYSGYKMTIKISIEIIKFIVSKALSPFERPILEKFVCDITRSPFTIDFLGQVSSQGYSYQSAV